MPVETLIAHEKLVTIGSISSFSMFVKAYDWLRLFDQTSYYIRLLNETLKDIMSFILLIFLGLMMFGIPLSLLNLNRSQED